jgi:hypothetical protein
LKEISRQPFMDVIFQLSKEEQTHIARGRAARE